MPKSMVIIGAGLAGLATGIYAQLNGYDTTIFELHDKPGGLCTAWKRRGYTFEGCVHAISGTATTSGLHRLWRELGVDFGPDAVVTHDNLVRLEDEGGRAVVLYTDPDRLEQHLLELSPADAPVIKEFVGAVRRAAKLDYFSTQMGGIAPFLRLMPHLPLVMKWGKVSLGQLADRFGDPFLRRAMRYIQYSMPFIPSFVPMMFLAGMRRGDLGFPRGGGLAFAQAMERRYLDLGGKIRYRSRVAKILTKDNRATGVLLADGTEHPADIVVSAADGYSTIYGMLDGRYVDDKIANYYSRRVPQGPQSFAVHVSFGVAREMPRTDHALVLLAGSGDGADAAKPIIAGLPHDRLDVEIYAFDPALAPAGKTTVKVALESDYDFWQRLRQEGDEAYQAEKQRTAEAVLDWLERRFPGIREQVEVVDVATPLTSERYTANYRGLQAWGASDTVSFSTKGFTRTLPGLTGFHMVGQWAEATIGLSTAAASGRSLVKRLVKAEGRRFVGA